MNHPHWKQYDDDLTATVTGDNNMISSDMDELRGRSSPPSLQQQQQQDLLACAPVSSEQHQPSSSSSSPAAFPLHSTFETLQQDQYHHRHHVIDPPRKPAAKTTEDHLSLPLKNPIPLPPPPSGLVQRGIHQSSIPTSSTSSPGSGGGMGQQKNFPQRVSSMQCAHQSSGIVCHLSNHQCTIFFPLLMLFIVDENVG
jgi:hypothetical protein